MLAIISCIACLLAVTSAGQFTVTDEAWLEVEVKDMDGPGLDYHGKITIALFGETVPMTVLNFASLTKGYKTKGGKLLTYKDTPIHRIVPDFVIQMGDVSGSGGSGGKSIYGQMFVDEDFTLSHRSAGWVSMANHGKDTNASQFFIMLNKARWLDGKHVVFGKVIRGYDVLRTLGELPADPNTAVPKNKITVINSGLNSLERKYDLEPDQLDSTDDL